MSEADSGLKAASARFRKKIFDLSTRAQKSDTARQRAAYSYWSDTPEVRFSGIWVGRAMSKSTILAARREPDGEIVPADPGHPSVDLVASIAGGPGGQSQLLEAFGPHLVVAGEGWVVIVPREDGRDDDWFALSVSEVEQGDGRGMKATIVIDGEERVILVPPAGDDNSDPLAPLGIRIWNPHPERYSRADSAVMSSMVILDELRLLNAAIAAIAKSRLVGRGILWIPEGAKLPDGDDLMDRLLDVAELAYKDPSSAAAGVPIVVEVPRGDHMKPERTTFESSFDEFAMKLREEAIRRFATGADVPAEVLLGTADVNHWGVWAIRDEAIEVGVEPRLATFCDGITKQWLWPALQSKNVDDWRDHLVWYDTSNLRVRTNRPQTAIELGKDNIISDAAVRRETGFDDGDAAPVPTAVEMALGLVAQQPGLMVSPGLADVVRQITEVSEGGTTPETDEEGTEVDLPVDETQAPPDTIPADPVGDVPASSTTLAAAIDGLIVRALERAGNKLRSSRPRSELAKTGNLRASAFHTALVPTATEMDSLRLLEGAWDRVPEIATRYDVREDCLVGLLDDYTRALLLSGIEHTYDFVPNLVRDATCLQPA